jgi:hypothetical protein
MGSALCRGTLTHRDAHPVLACIRVAGTTVLPKPSRHACERQAARGQPNGLPSSTSECFQVCLELLLYTMPCMLSNLTGWGRHKQCSDLELTPAAAECRTLGVLWKQKYMNTTTTSSTQRLPNPDACFFSMHYCCCTQAAVPSHVQHLRAAAPVWCASASTPTKAAANLAQ